LIGLWFLRFDTMGSFYHHHFRFVQHAQNGFAIFYVSDRPVLAGLR
jgi:hypothetical protein